MFPWLQHRPGHYALLLLVGLGLFFPCLGSPSLWDIDEGNNAEAAREMFESGHWIVPTFNFNLRPDKPALLYWLQIASYRAFGINEFAARFPSALAALFTMVLVYELGRALFSPITGLLSGLILATTVLFCFEAHFANPDAILLLFMVLNFFCFYLSIVHKSWVWFMGAGISAGLAVLAKGPVGLILPMTINFVYLVCSRQLSWLWNPRLLLAMFAFIIVACPWYVLVGAETKGEFLRAFIEKHNVGRYLVPMEGHGGPFYYYLTVLPFGLAPWFTIFALAGWRSWRGRKTQNRVAPILVAAFPYPVSFLWCWIGVYVLFFSFAATKLPNYILPICPPAAILTAWLLEQWRQREPGPRPWELSLSLGSLALAGVGVFLGMLILGGAIDIPLRHHIQMPELRAGAGLGLLLIAGSAIAAWFAWRQQLGRMAGCLVISGIIYLGTLGTWGAKAIDHYKAPRSLVNAAFSSPAHNDLWIGTYQYNQPSLVFYCRRKVQSFEREDKVLDFLRYPVPVYLVVPAPLWQRLERKVQGPHRLLASHFDLYRNCDVLVVTNQ